MLVCCQHRHIEYTYVRCLEQGHVVFDPHHPTQPQCVPPCSVIPHLCMTNATCFSWLVFHTGLSTPLQEPLYAYLVRRRPPTPQRDEHDDGDAAVREAGAPRFTGVVEWWKNGSGEIRCEELHSVVSKPAVYVHFSQLVMARRAAKELHEGMDVEFSVEPNPKRPGRMWATHVTLPGGDRIPGAWCSSWCVHARVRGRARAHGGMRPRVCCQVVLRSHREHPDGSRTPDAGAVRLRIRRPPGNVSLPPRPVLAVRGAACTPPPHPTPGMPCLTCLRCMPRFDPTLHVSANIQHIVEDNWPRFSEACVLPPRMSVAVTKRTSAGGRELWLPPASTIAHCCRLVKTALAAARERAAGNNYLATPHYFYAQVGA